ncbi:class I SAM-dependent methyltransferase [bacterium]|nr:class I SAM-dependent methyltransferase [candidate division CSSED10-310 bacterium]
MKLKKIKTEKTNLTPQPWTEVIARFYDWFDAYDGDFLMWQQLLRNTESPLLELGCGTGRILIQLAREGYHITGLEMSKAMITQAEHKIAQCNMSVRKRIRILQGDMSCFDYGKFGGVISACNSFVQLPDRSKQLDTLCCIRKALSPGGCAHITIPRWTAPIGKQINLQSPSPFFLFEDSKNPETGWQTRMWCQYGPSSTVEVSRYRFKFEEFRSDGLNVTSYSPENGWHVFCDISMEDMIRLAKSAGLKTVDVFGDEDFRKPDEAEETLVFRFQKD